MRKVLLIVFIGLSISVLYGIVLVKAKENSTYLIGKIIYVDAGHGGKDNGANFDGILEDEINMNIAGYIMEELLDKGAHVLTSRTGDYDLSDIYDKNKKRKDMLNRVRRINEGKPDLFLSIHLNSYSSQNVSGAQVFYQDNASSKMLANNVQAKLNKVIEKDRKVKIGDYYILNKTIPVGVLVECGFLSNDNERAKLILPSYQKMIAENIVLGVVEYFNK